VKISKEIALTRVKMMLKHMKQMLCIIVIFFLILFTYMVYNTIIVGKEESRINVSFIFPDRKVFSVGERIEVTAVICSNESKIIRIDYPGFYVKIYRNGLYLGTEPSFYVQLDIFAQVKLIPGKCYRKTISVPLHLPGRYTLQPCFVFKEADSSKELAKAEKKAIIGEEKTIVVKGHLG